MKISDCLNADQVDSLVSLIRNQCNRAARNEMQLTMRIPEDLCAQLKKGRKAHDITGDIYIAAFIAENQIEGVHVKPVKSGIYTQPEFTVNNTIIHIYHHSNKLSSLLITSRANALNSNFFCIRYKIDEGYRLEYIEALYLNGETKTKEIIYTAPDISVKAG